jgi:iron(III) transport system ATP-binding protein
VLHQGKIVQKGTPEEVYNRPINEYVAALFGKFILVSPELIRLFPSLENHDRRFIRPGDFQISQRKDAGVEGEVLFSNFMGNYFEMEVNASGLNLIITHISKFKTGETIFVSVKPKHQSHHLE